MAPLQADGDVPRITPGVRQAIQQAPALAVACALSPPRDQRFPVEQDHDPVHVRGRIEKSDAQLAVGRQSAPAGAMARQRDRVMENDIDGAADMAVAREQRTQILPGENVLTHAVMCRRQPEPGLLHVIAGGDESERLRGAWIVQAEACGTDRQGDLGIAGRQALRVFVVAQRHRNLATLHSRRATIPGIRHSGATVALHLCPGPSPLTAFRACTLASGG
jgi:hypothetical protein